MVLRENYFKDILAFKDKQIIKVLTGLRRCGKSFLLEQIIDRYLDEGINENQIIYYRLDDIENENLLDYKTLYEIIKARLDSRKMNYIFLTT